MVESLTDLPAELLNQVICYVETAKDLSRLALTCKKIHFLVAKDGYRVFVQSKFPSIPTPVPVASQVEGLSLFWKDAAHSLTTLSRNWDRKAFIAQSIGPWGDSSHSIMESRRRDRRGRSVHRQTMGFTPVIDSYEAWDGSGWASRKQTVAWGAGPELIVGSRELPEPHEGSQNPYGWAVYRERGTIDGRDDITYVQLLHNQSSVRGHVLVGRVNGDLARISMGLDERNGRHERLVSFNTGGRPVKSASVNHDDLLAACLSNGSLALFPLNGDTAIVDPVEDINILSSPKGKIWTTCFLDKHRLATGYGPASDPIKIFDLTHGTLSKHRNLARSIHFVKKNGEYNAQALTSTYSLAPLPTSSSADGREGDLFLSGAYDGIARLHDLRSADTVVSTFEDPVDFSAIYSLLPFGCERFIAGGALHALIKMFDLRMPGERMYHATNAQSFSHEPKNWNVFLGKGSPSSLRGSMSIESPVYSLSRPSQCSPTFFAGVENRVVQMDLVSIMDKHPDPVYGGMPDTGYRARDIGRKWKPHSRISCLPMYEHDDGLVRLRMQRDVGLYNGIFQGWDERWTIS